MKLTKLIYEAGIIGCGGAGFPTHAKYNGTVETIIINGAECEPLLQTDRYLIRNKARELIQAAVGGQIVGGILLVLLVPGLEIRHFIKMIQDVNEGSLRRILLHSGVIRQKHQVRQFAGCHGQIQLFAEPAGIDSGHF